MNYHGDISIKCNYEDVWNFHEGLAAVKLNNLWGYIDKKGDYIIESRFMDARDFSEGIARVSLDTRYTINRTQISKESSYGFINKKGELIIDLIFSEAKDFTNGFAAIKYNNIWNFINKTGFLLFKENFDVCNSFHENNALVIKNQKYYFCLLYTSPSPRDRTRSRMPSSA